MPAALGRETSPETDHFPHCSLRLADIGYLFFQLKTHADCFTEEEDDEETKEGAALSLSGAFFLLTLITIVVAICSGEAAGVLAGPWRAATGALAPASRSHGM